MELTRLGNTFNIIGNLNETFEVPRARALLEEIAAEGHTSCNLNFKDVPRANSCGVAELLHLLESTSLPIFLCHCPTWLVDQLNQIEEFFLPNVRVTSIYAPYTNPYKHKYVMRLIELEDGFLESPRFQTIETFTSEDGDELQADFERDDFFFFLQNQAR
jgi:hypothetical protein